MWDLRIIAALAVFQTAVYALPPVVNDDAVASRSADAIASNLADAVPGLSLADDPGSEKAEKVNEAAVSGAVAPLKEPNPLASEFQCPRGFSRENLAEEAQTSLKRSALFDLFIGNRGSPYFRGDDELEISRRVLLVAKEWSRQASISQIVEFIKSALNVDRDKETAKKAKELGESLLKRIRDEMKRVEENPYLVLPKMSNKLFTLTRRVHVYDTHGETLRLLGVGGDEKVDLAWLDLYYEMSQAANTEARKLYDPSTDEKYQEVYKEPAGPDRSGRLSFIAERGRKNLGSEAEERIEGAAAHHTKLWEDLTWGSAELASLLSLGEPTPGPRAGEPSAEEPSAEPSAEASSGS